MNLIGAIVGGVVGGLVGAAVWGAVTYYSGWEIGWIAWGIGGLVGLGVHLGGRGHGGAGLGAVAVVLALAAVLLGKYATVRIELSAYLASDAAPLSVIADIIVAERDEAGRPVRMPRPEFAESLSEMYPPDVWNEAVQRWEAMDPGTQEAARAAPPLANPEFGIVWLADEVVEDYEQRGQAVDWPPGMNVEVAWRQAHYPADVWAEAVSRWDAMSEAEQTAHTAYVGLTIEQGMALDEQEALAAWFIDSFTFFDLLWFGLAAGIAAKIGARGPSRDDVLEQPLEAEDPTARAPDLEPPPDSRP